MIMSTGSGAGGHKSLAVLMVHTAHTRWWMIRFEWQINIQTEQTCCCCCFPSSLLVFLLCFCLPLLRLLTVHVLTVLTNSCTSSTITTTDLTMLTSRTSQDVGRTLLRLWQHIQIRFDGRIRNTAQPGGCCCCCCFWWRLDWRNYRASPAMATGIDRFGANWVADWLAGECTSKWMQC